MYIFLTFLWTSKNDMEMYAAGSLDFAPHCREPLWQMPRELLARLEGNKLYRPGLLGQQGTES